jgi:hypothetical protein
LRYSNQTNAKLDPFPHICGIQGAASLTKFNRIWSSLGTRSGCEVNLPASIPKFMAQAMVRPIHQKCQFLGIRAIVDLLPNRVEEIIRLSGKRCVGNVKIAICVSTPTFFVFMEESKPVALDVITSIEMLGTAAMWMEFGDFRFVDDGKNC